MPVAGSARPFWQSIPSSNVTTDLGFDSGDAIRKLDPLIG